MSGPRRPDVSAAVAPADVSVCWIMLAVAVGSAWLPVETHTTTAVAIAAVVLVLTPWGWRRSEIPTVTVLAVSAAVGVALCCSAGSGYDPSRAVGALGLASAMIALAWLASRTQPTDRDVALLAFGLAALTLWGMWQVAGGMESLAGKVDTIPEASRAYVMERLASGRAYASLPLPSHFAVVLATALPLLLARVRADGFGLAAAAGAVLSVVGLVLSRSPVGIGLAILASAMVLLGGRRRVIAVTTVGLGAALSLVVAARPDVIGLEPVALRLDNWRTAGWLWLTAPADGAGLSSFAQATQNAPLVVGNRPAHAHSLPFEALAELGPVGLGAAALLAIALIRLVIALWPRDRALAAAIVVVPLHNLVDFSFFVSGVAVPWAILLGWGVAVVFPARPVRRQGRGRIAAVIVAAGGLALTVLHLTGVVVEHTAATRPNAVERFDGARRSLQLAPWRVEPQFLLAAAALDSRDQTLCGQARQELEDRRWWRPRSGALAERRAKLALACGDVTSAVSELWAAVEFGPYDEERMRQLDDALSRLGGTGHETAD